MFAEHHSYPPEVEKQVIVDACIAKLNGVEYEADEVLPTAPRSAVAFVRYIDWEEKGKLHSLTESVLQTGRILKRVTNSYTLEIVEPSEDANMLLISELHYIPYRDTLLASQALIDPTHEPTQAEIAEYRQHYFNELNAGLHDGTPEDWNKFYSVLGIERNDQ